MNEPTRQQVLHAVRERIAHLEIHRGRGPIKARIHELECMRTALRLLAGTNPGDTPAHTAGQWGDYTEEDGYPGSLAPRKRGEP